ncbi:Hypothetical protein PHPALM_37056 [Phytophthora palmivora]|uniref:Uncharacterized protein n=1 Tax=Phytophthora palmivora TaxID=4796 RepID=A0A2P4WYD6_9STRA|nr:Hypothetical protein PHPALM_37056 [Phytophthora palmivora]
MYAYQACWCSINHECFEKPRVVLIYSGAPGNYVVRSTAVGSERYAEALQARARDIDTGCLTTVTRITVDWHGMLLGFRRGFKVWPHSSNGVAEMPRAMD